MSIKDWWFSEGRVNLSDIPSTLRAKFAIWTSKRDENENYYVNQIGYQDRGTVTEGETVGVIHSGRGVKYDGAKSQYSRTVGNTPTNFRLVNNSITLSFWIKGTPPASGYGLIYGSHSTASGVYSALSNTNGTISFFLRHSGVFLTYNSPIILDDTWHHVCVVIDKTSNYVIYIDNVALSTTNITALVFADRVSYFNIGGQASYFNGVTTYRDVRLFSRGLSVSEVNEVYKQNYISGVISWWLCEGGNESNAIGLRDCVGSNHLQNYAFDSSSLSTGIWPSLLNKFGYSITPYLGSDALGGIGSFTSTTGWDFTASRFSIESGYAYFKAVDAVLPTLLMTNIPTFIAGLTYRISFDITQGATATFSIQNGQGVIYVTEAVYSVGHYDINIYLTSPYRLLISANYLGGVFKMDNLTITEYDASIILPKIDSAIPSKDVHDRNLVFVGQAKYNLQKVNESVVNLPDYVSEIISDCDLITLNDWYDSNGVGNEIALSNIVAYQSGRQYYKNEELIIIKKGEVLTDDEDYLLKRKLMIIDEYAPTPPYYLGKKAIGKTIGTTAEIYTLPSAIMSSSNTSTISFYRHQKSTLDPSKRYIAMGWADFFPEDPLYILPLLVKYKQSSTFYSQLRPITNDYLNEPYREDLRLTELMGSRIGNHAYHHINFFYNLPTWDGVNTPSDNDLKLNRGDGLNEFGFNINNTVNSSIGIVGSSWMGLSSTILNKAWKDLTVGECSEFRKSASVFGKIDGVTLYLKGLDYLSNRYCGTTGYSVVGGDYATATPNTSNSLYPTNSTRILGGIFQGASTLQNHEVWERILQIEQGYHQEFYTYLNPLKFWGTPGGGGDILLYESSGLRYQDKAHTKLGSGCVPLLSSILNQSRSWVECLQNAGYITTMSAQAQGYATLGEVNRLEGQRIYKKNGLKKPDNVGDGYVNALRIWDSTIPEADINTLLASSDLVKSLYDYTYTNTAGRYISNSEYTSLPAFDDTINRLIQFSTWGITPDFVGDSGGGTSINKASWTMVLESLFQFCKRADITIISHEEAITMGMTKTLPIGYNYFPNSGLATTVKTVINSTNAIVYPDGWNGGIVVVENTGDGNTNVLYQVSAGIIFTRQYAIKPGTFNLSFKAKGIGTLKIRKILNKDTFNSTSGSSFTEINSVTINSENNYSTYTSTVTIPDAPLEIYGAPATPQEEVYQNYMKGYGDKICGIQIEIVVVSDNYIKLGNPTLI